MTLRALQFIVPDIIRTVGMMVVLGARMNLHKVGVMPRIFKFVQVISEIHCLI